MKKDTYEDLVKEISKKLSEKILQEEGDLTGRIKTIDADIAAIVREVGLRTSKLVIEKTCEEKVAKKKPRD
jgi:23S rRNA maturation-related 3'-5' exoribonuclease YhaM